MKEELLQTYRARLERLGHESKEMGDYFDFPDESTLLCHCAWMIEQMPMLPDDKSNRWLGFIQGVFATTQVYTIAEMRGHNRANV